MGSRYLTLQIMRNRTIWLQNLEIAENMRRANFTSYTGSYNGDLDDSTATMNTAPVEIGSASTGFLIWGVALVFLMTPGLALFYSGLSRHNSALSLMMLVMMAMSVVTIQWFLFGFSLAFSEVGGPFIGDFSVGAFTTLGNRAMPLTSGAVPSIVFMLFQMQFATITAALVFGSVPERTRFVPAMVFVFFWTTFVYDFVAYWTWADHGFLKNLSCLGSSTYPCLQGSYDFAGGGPVHITAGFSGLAYVLVLGKRKLIHAEHHNLVNVVFGTGVLWFGWFAFNGGSAGAATTRAAMAATVTTVAAAAGGLTWVFFDYYSTKKLSAFGFCSGVVAGLVGITPASGYVAPWAAVLIGFLTALASNGCCRLKKRLGIDDSFDAGSIHGAGGFVGNVLTGIFAQNWITTLDGNNQPGGVIEGQWIQVVYQIVASAVIAVWAFSVSYIILVIINKIPGLHLRQSEADELLGGDLAEMGEAGYILSDPEPSFRAISIPLPDRSNAVHPTVHLD